MLGHARHAEGGGHRPGRDHEAVVAERAEPLDLQLAPVEVGAGRPGPCTTSTLAWRWKMPRGRVGDVVGVEAGRGHLVEQRLEEVVVVGVDEHDVDGGAAQRLGGAEPAEAGPDHDDPVTARACRRPSGGPAGQRRCQAGTKLSWSSRMPSSATDTKPPTFGGSIW